MDVQVHSTHADKFSCKKNKTHAATLSGPQATSILKDSMKRTGTLGKGELLNIILQIR